MKAANARRDSVLADGGGGMLTARRRARLTDGRSAFSERALGRAQCVVRFGFSYSSCTRKKQQGGTGSKVPV